MDLGNISKKVADAYTVRSSVVLTPTGSVVRTDHDKFLLVVDVSGGTVHTCVINTKPNRFAPKGSQVEIDGNDLPSVSSERDTLTHKSYVDCSKVVDVGEDEFRLAVERGFFEPKGHLGDVAMMYVQNAGLKCDALRPFEKKYFE